MTNENSDLPPNNHGGRPKGSRDLRSKSERLLDRLMNSRGDNLTRIVDGVLKMAESGESWAAKAVLDRCWAVPRGRMVRLNLGGDPVGAIDRVIGAVDSGDISAAEAKDFIDVIKARSELIEARDLEARLAALEQDVTP
jgi:hypothetical protein